MARTSRLKVEPGQVQGIKYLKLLEGPLARLRGVGTERDRAGNRRLFFDELVSLVLLYFFTPSLTSLQAIQQATELRKVQQAVGGARRSLGSLSEATRVFDADELLPIISELASNAVPTVSGREAEALKGLTAVDGTLLPALPRMVWALWLDESHRAAKLHLKYEVFRQVPVDARVTHGNASEKEQLRSMLESDRLYVIDRGYAEYQLFQDIIDAGSSFVGRIRDNAVWKVVEERPLTKEAIQAGVRRDMVVQLGCDTRGRVFKQHLRVVEIHFTKRDGTTEVMFLATDRLNLSADLVALAYRYRWTIELFFRWFKYLLGCLHLISESENGLKIQIYVALIAALLVSLWVGRKPTKRTLEMLQFYLAGWATEEELVAHFMKLKKHDG